jgi:hypothetical protein
MQIGEGWHDDWTGEDYFFEIDTEVNGAATEGTQAEEATINDIQAADYNNPDNWWEDHDTGMNWWYCSINEDWFIDDGTMQATPINNVNSNWVWDDSTQTWWVLEDSTEKQPIATSTTVPLSAVYTAPLEAEWSISTVIVDDW